MKGGFTIARGAVIENAQGAAGNDQITGNAAGNTLEGNAGDDVVKGLEGNDVLRGGEGRDRLEGGGGADRFVFTALGDTPNSSPDVIGGWDASDVIDLSVLDDLIAGDLRLVSAATRTGAPGEVSVERSGGGTQVLVTADGRPGIDVSIRLEGTHALTANDFLL